MFYCHFTGKLSKAGESPSKLITQVRNKTYYRTNHKSGQREVVGRGTEIVQEVLVSREHYEKLIAEGFVPQLVKDKDEALVQFDQWEESHEPRKTDLAALKKRFERD